MSDLVFYHSPNTRSAGVYGLLEELGVPYEMRVLNMKADEQRKAEFMAVNPMGKVPAIVDRGQLVTEQPAIYIHLGDRFIEKGLAPALDDPLRGPYLRWLVYYGSAFEPAVVDKALKRDAAPQRMCPYGDYDTTLSTLVAQLAKGPYILGDRFTAADILWGTSLGWTTSFKIVPLLPEIAAYIERINARPALKKVKEADVKLAAEQQPA